MTFTPMRVCALSAPLLFLGGCAEHVAVPPAEPVAYVWSPEGTATQAYGPAEPAPPQAAAPAPPQAPPQAGAATAPPPQAAAQPWVESSDPRWSTHRLATPPEPGDTGGAPPSVVYAPNVTYAAPPVVYESYPYPYAYGGYPYAYGYPGYYYGPRPFVGVRVGVGFHGGYGGGFHGGRGGGFHGGGGGFHGRR